MIIHLVRHFPAVKNPEIESLLGATEGGKLRPLDVQKAAKLALIFRERIEEMDPCFVMMGHSPTIRAATTMLVCTVGIIGDMVPVVEVPELYWTDESIAGIMADFKAHDVNTAEWSVAGLEALDVLGKTGADGIRRVLAERNLNPEESDGDTLFVGHGPLTAATAYHLAGNTGRAKEFCLSRLAKEGSRFVVCGGNIIFVPLE